MSFYHPNILYGLFAILIPIIIHLFNFKRFKKVYFTNVRFLRNVQQQSKRHSQWRHLLVLLMRILAIIFLVLAFARPFIPIDENKQQQIGAQNYVTVFLDNSFSMQAESAEGNLLEDGRKKAREVVLAYKPSDHFRLILNNQIPESNRFVNRDEFLDLLDEVDINPASVSMSSVIKRVSQFDFGQQKYLQDLYMISDFQQSQADIDLWEVDSSLQVNLLPLVSAGQNNVFIDSCWFELPILQKNTTIKLSYRIKNLSSQDAEKIPVSLIINEHQKALGSVDLKAYEERTETISFRVDSSGVFHGRIEIRDFPIIYDDHFFFSFTIAQQIQVLSINGANSNDAVNRFYSGDSLFIVRKEGENRVDYSSFSDYNLIILNELENYSSGFLMELDKYLEQSGLLVIIPSNNTSLDQFNSMAKAFALNFLWKKDTTKSRINWMDVESVEFQDVFDLKGNKFRLPDHVDMPFFHTHGLFQSGARTQFDDLVKFDDGSSFLRKYQRKQSVIYLFTTSFSESNSNITSHAIFVPLMFNLALQGEALSDLYFTLGEEHLLEIQHAGLRGEQDFLIRSKNREFEFIPTHIQNNRNFVVINADDVISAGNYQIIQSGNEVQSCAFNYSRVESDLRSITLEDLENNLNENGLKNINIITSSSASLTTEINSMRQGLQLWKLFLGLAILLLIIELFLLRFMK